MMEFCPSCGASIPHRDGEGRCEKCINLIDWKPPTEVKDMTDESNRPPEPSSTEPKKSNPMSFTVDMGHGLESFFLDFKRHSKEVTTWSGVKRPSSKPYTTVFIMKDGGFGSTSDEIFLSHTVGCLASDQFDRAKGRISALRAVGKTLSPEFRAAMWTAYMTRKPPKVKMGKAQVGVVVPFPKR